MNTLSIKTILQTLEEIAGDNAAEVLSSEGSSLNKVSHKISLKIVDTLRPQFFKLDDKERDSNEGLSFNKIIIAASVIEQKSLKAQTVFNRVISKLKESDISFVSEEEITDARSKLLGDNTTPRDFALDENSLYNEMKQIYCTNAAIRSGLFTPGVTFNTVG